MRKIVFILAVISLYFQSVAQQGTTSQALYATLKPSIVQIKILNQITGEKSSIGSGFIVEQNNLIATNYHVIAQIATQPDSYYGQYRTTDNRVGNVELIAFDVINDLALLRADANIAAPLPLAPLPQKGGAIFSLGNPHDLGFVIVNGVNNGIIPKQEPPRVFFSASINSGMSGGPAVNATGKVVGINVAVRRDSGDISFLIPANYLEALIGTAKVRYFAAPADPEKDYAATINQQLLADSAQYFAKLQKAKRDRITLGNLRFPHQIGANFICWSLDEDEDDEPLLVTHSGVVCRQNRSHYISAQETQGSVSFAVHYLKTTEPISRRRFYRYVTASESRDTFTFSYTTSNDNPAKCLSDFVDIAGYEFKIHICSQADKKRHGLAQTRLLATSVSDADEAWALKLNVQGSTTQEALDLAHSLLNDITVIPQPQ